MRRQRSRRNPNGVSGTEIAIIAGGALAVGVIGYLLYKNAQPAAPQGASLNLSLPGGGSVSATTTGAPATSMSDPNAWATQYGTPLSAAQQADATNMGMSMTQYIAALANSGQGSGAILSQYMTPPTS